MRMLLLSAVIVAPSAVLAQAPPTSNTTQVEQPPDPKAKINACLSSDISGASLSNHVIGCYEKELRRQDAKLNGFYQQLIKKFPEIRTKLLEGQRAWIAYRDNWCGYEGLIDQPPSSAASKAICLSELTEAQARRLEELSEIDPEAEPDAPKNAGSIKPRR